MNKVTITLLVLLAAVPSRAQIDFSARSYELLMKYNGGEVPLQEQYEYAGTISGYNTYLTAINPVKKKKAAGTKKPSVYFLKGQNVKIGGWETVVFCLENNTSKNIRLNNRNLSADLQENEIRDIKEFIGIAHQWYELQRVTGDCGGPAFKGRWLAPGQQAAIAVSMNSLNVGSEKALFKISVLVGKQWIDSQAIEITLYENQIKALVQSQY